MFVYCFFTFLRSGMSVDIVPIFILIFFYSACPTSQSIFFFFPSFSPYLLHVAIYSFLPLVIILPPSFPSLTSSVFFLLSCLLFLLTYHREGRKNLRPAEEMLIKGLAVKIRPYEYISVEDAPQLIGKSCDHSTVSCCIMSYYIVLCYVMLCYIISCHIILYYAVLH